MKSDGNNLLCLTSLLSVMLLKLIHTIVCINSLFLLFCGVRHHQPSFLDHHEAKPPVPLWQHPLQRDISKVVYTSNCTPPPIPPTPALALPKLKISQHLP